MNFENRTVTLKDGRTCTLRPTCPDDAELMIEYMKVTAGETQFILRYPDEVNYTLEQEAELLNGILNDQSSVMIVGIVDGRVAGNCSINGLGNKRKLTHRCSLAITLYQEFWGIGIGTAMIEYLTELAMEIGYEQIDLEVVAENEQARALYRKCGFTETGKRARALKFDDGSYHDEILMVKMLP